MLERLHGATGRVAGAKGDVLREEAEVATHVIEIDKEAARRRHRALRCQLVVEERLALAHLRRGAQDSHRRELRNSELDKERAREASWRAAFILDVDDGLVTLDTISNRCQAIADRRDRGALVEVATVAEHACERCWREVVCVSWEGDARECARSSPTAAKHQAHHCPQQTWRATRQHSKEEADEEDDDHGQNDEDGV